MIILGIDPGLANTGWGIIESRNQKYRALSYDLIKTDTSSDLPIRINIITEKIESLIDEYKVEAVSIEEIFFLKNVSSAISVAKVMGAIMNVCVKKNIKVKTFTPLEVKTVITGIGRAEKQQVSDLVKLLLGINEKIKVDHISDALAIATTYAIMDTTKSSFRRTL